MPWFAKEPVIYVDGRGIEPHDGSIDFNICFYRTSFSSKTAQSAKCPPKKRFT